ncbi:MAG TPA: hypothetical protein VK850_16765, partial [Candidatus Binatia bacterium]|nr:hypothetical protein [Candidatus Binatia bacterium]
MRCSILWAAVSLAISASAQTQPASQEEISRALDVLRKTPAVAPPPTARPGVPLKITTGSNAAPSTLAPGRPLVAPPHSAALTADMERRAREVLEGTRGESRTPAITPAKEVLEKANAREEMRKQAVEETRRGVPQTATTTGPGSLAQEEERKAQEEIDRQKNIERIEMEVQRARLAREQKTAAQGDAVAKTNAPAPVIAAAQTNAPSVAAATTNASAAVKTPAIVTKTPPPEPTPTLAADKEAKARALLEQMLKEPATPTAKPAPEAPAPPPVAKSAPTPKPAPAAAPAPSTAATPTPAKPAPIVPAQPVVPTEPKPV